MVDPMTPSERLNHLHAIRFELVKNNSSRMSIEGVDALIDRAQRDSEAVDSKMFKALRRERMEKAG